MAIRCNLCLQDVAAHCPPSNPMCDWLVCRNPGCTAHVYDLHRGLLRHTDGHVETWADQPTTEGDQE